MLRAGKLPAAMLGRLLESLPAPDSSVIQGPAVGEDAAVVDTGGPDLLVVKTDPITFAAEDSGRYLLAVNGNDLATCGAEPRWLLATVLLPEGVAEERVEAVFASLREACREAGVWLVGGHTEITVGLDRPILVGCLLGQVARDRLLRTSGARAGDALLLAGAIALEGAAILAREHSGTLRARGVAGEVIARAAGWLESPGISVLPAARLLRGCARVHALHDPTEGGLATALAELAEAAGVSLSVDFGAVPVLEECASICGALGLDPMGLLASGALLASVAPEDAAGAAGRLREAGIPGAVIGRVLARGDAGASQLPRFARDELARFLERAGS